MACNDVAALADQNWIREAERTNAAGDLRNLPSTMRPRVARIRDQPIQRPVLDLKTQPVILSIQVVLIVHFTTPMSHPSVVPTHPPPPNLSAIFSRRSPA